ncbi:MAG: flippase [candidate division WOR-3 bacterium]
MSIADIANKVLMFFFYVLAARHLGVERYGILSFGFAYATMFSALTDLGLGAVAAREIARKQRSVDELVSNAMAIKLVIAFLVMILIGVSVNILGYPPENRTIVYICSLFVLETAFVAYFCNIFQGFQRMEFTALIRVIQGLILLTGVLILKRFPPVSAHYAWLYAGAGLVATVTGLVILTRKFIPISLSFNFKKWCELLREGLPIGVSVIFVLFYYWNGSTLLAKLAGDKAVGVYNAGFRLVAGLNFLGISFSSALYPVFSSTFLTDTARLKQLLTRALRWIIVMLLPVAILGMILAEQLIIFIYGNNYQSAGVVLRILVWWAFATGFTSVFSNYFMATQRARWMTLQTASALAINVLLNLILIRRLGPLGAAIAIVAAEFTSGVFYFAIWQIIDRYRAGLSLVGKSLLRVVISLLPAGVAAAVVARVHILLGLSTGLWIYIILLFVFREIKSADLEIFKSFFNRLR